MSKTIHESITEQRVMEAAEDSTFGMGSTGFCIECGAEQSGCEPDAREYECDGCGERQVFGAQELLITGQYR